MNAVAAVGFGLAVAWLVKLVVNGLVRLYGDRDSEFRERLSDVWDRLHEQSAAQLASATAQTVVKYGGWHDDGAWARARRFARWSGAQTSLATVFALALFLRVAQLKDVFSRDVLMELASLVSTCGVLSFGTWYVTSWLLRSSAGWRSAGAYVVFAAAVLFWLYVGAFACSTVVRVPLILATESVADRQVIVDLVVDDAVSVLPLFEGIFAAQHLAWYWLFATLPAILLLVFCAVTLIFTCLPRRSTAALRWLVFDWATGAVGVLERTSRLVTGAAGALAAVAQWLRGG